MPVCSITNIP